MNRDILVCKMMLALIALGVSLLLLESGEKLTAFILVINGFIVGAHALLQMWVEEDK